MKLPNIKILDEVDKRLREVSKEVTFPLSKEDKKNVEDMITYLTMSQIEIGIPKRIFVIVEELEDETFKNYIIINPRIVSHSEEMIYVGEGEGCLSINRDVEGIVPRYARITVEAQDLDGNTFQIRVREDIAIAFQHEIDHLNGILFIDKIDPKNPFKDAQKYREI